MSSWLQRTCQNIKTVSNGLEDESRKTLDLRTMGALVGRYKEASGSVLRVRIEHLLQNRFHALMLHLPASVENIPSKHPSSTKADYCPKSPWHTFDSPPSHHPNQKTRDWNDLEMAVFCEDPDEHLPRSIGVTKPGIGHSTAV